MTTPTMLRTALAAGLLCLISLATPALADPGPPGADAVLASVNGSAVGCVSAAPDTRDNSAASITRHGSGPLAFGCATASVSSFLVGTGQVSHSDVSLSDISLFDGLITADTLTLAADASASAGSTGADTAGSSVSGLRIDGKAVEATRRSAGVPGIGTIEILVATSSSNASAANAEVIGLRVTLSEAADGLAAGSVVVVGRVAVHAEADTAAALDKKAKEKPRQTAVEVVVKDKAKAGEDREEASGSSGPGEGGTGNGVDAGYGAGPKRRNGSGFDGMADPVPPEKWILNRFPGAVFPVDGRCTYSDDWGAPRASIPSHRHEGNDIFADLGTPIVAILDGTVTISTTGIGGNNVHLTTSDGSYFYYAHLVRFAKGLESGDEVTAGQVVGYVGTTGDARGTPPHLHFEIHPDGGDPVDPYPYLEAWRAAAAGLEPACDDTGDSSVDTGDEAQDHIAARRSRLSDDTALSGFGTLPAAPSTDAAGRTLPVDVLTLALLSASLIGAFRVRTRRATRDDTL